MGKRQHAGRAHVAFEAVREDERGTAVRAERCDRFRVRFDHAAAAAAGIRRRMFFAGIAGRAGKLIGFLHIDAGSAVIAQNFAQLDVILHGSTAVRTRIILYQSFHPHILII